MLLTKWLFSTGMLDSLNVCVCVCGVGGRGSALYLSTKGLHS